MKHEMAIAFGGIMVGFSLAILLACIGFGLTTPETFIDFAYCTIQIKN
ncbi:TPA: hypothetical protein PXM28_001487 [Yersinia enterocolitica]|nr:hypothetical protein [Yersinia enterocolitica]